MLGGGLGGMISDDMKNKTKQFSVLVLKSDEKVTDVDFEGDALREELKTEMTRSLGEVFQQWPRAGWMGGSADFVAAFNKAYDSKDQILISAKKIDSEDADVLEEQLNGSIQKLGFHAIKTRGMFIDSFNDDRAWEASGGITRFNQQILQCIYNDAIGGGRTTKLIPIFTSLWKRINRSPNFLNHLINNNNENNNEINNEINNENEIDDDDDDENNNENNQILKNQIIKLEDEKEELTNKIINFEKEKELLKITSNDELENLRITLTNNFIKMETELTKQNSNLREELDLAQEKEIELTKSLKNDYDVKSDKEGIKYLNQIHILEEEKEVLTSKLSDYNKLKNMNDRMREKMEEMATIHSTLQDRLNTVTDLSSQRLTRILELEPLENDIEGNKKTVQEYKMKCKDLEINKLTLSSQLSVKNNEIDSLNQDVLDLQSKCKYFEEQIETVSGELQAIKEKEEIDQMMDSASSSSMFQQKGDDYIPPEIAEKLARLELENSTLKQASSSDNARYHSPFTLFVSLFFCSSFSFSVLLDIFIFHFFFCSLSNLTLHSSFSFVHLVTHFSA
mmetsp:Transcript_31423/g.40420  ORF Transcript_31423/g.40420 Transcript_31423/m.40420 type:complete len:566 (+) Transcript_31423:160-1857(+)